MRKLNWFTEACVISLLWAATAAALPAQTFTTLHNFDGTHGSLPFAGLVQGADGNLYGTTEFGGVYGEGTVFKITSDGTLATLYSFCSQGGCADGAYPDAGLVQATDGDFYGTAYHGGANSACNQGCGTVFKITPSGVLTTIYSFCSQSNCTDGTEPVAGLVQGADGNFFGTTAGGGGNSNPHCLFTFSESCGTAFKITPSGKLTTLYRFCSQSNCLDGADPQAGLIQGTDGNLYGTTSLGGANAAKCSGIGCGTIFKISPAGTLTILYSFCSKNSCRDGEKSESALVQGADGNLYGTTDNGGISNSKYCPFIPTCGTVFRISPSGMLTTLYRFCS